MKLWSKPKFNRVSRLTRMQDHTATVCRSVLCDGLTVPEALALHNDARTVSTIYKALERLKRASSDKLLPGWTVLKIQLPPELSARNGLEVVRDVDHLKRLAKLARADDIG